MSFNRVKPFEMPDIPENGGTVTSLSAQKKDANRCSIFLNGKYAFGVHMDVVLNQGTQKGMELSAEQCAELIQEDLYFKGLKRCLDFINYRPRTRKEITSRLEQLGIPTDLADRICARLDELGYIDDQMFAEQWSASRFRSKGFGPVKIKQELIQKGISVSIAEATVLDVMPESKIQAQLRNQLDLALRRYRKEADPSVKKRKIIQFLGRRGYPSASILAELANRKL